MPDRIDIFELIPALLREGKRLALCTVTEKIGSGPAEVGTRILVTGDAKIFGAFCTGTSAVGTIGGGELERVVMEAALKAIEEGKSKSLKFSLSERARRNELKTGLWCGGAMTVFIDVIEPKPELLIVGSGHVALQTYKIVDLLGFDVAVIDDSKDTLTKNRFPKAKLIYDKSFVKALKGVKVGINTYVAIVHGEPKHDLAALRRFVRERTAYLGLLGSARKIAKLKKILRKDGVPAKAIKRIKAPIGLDINARTPEEIAVSIAAELIKERRKA